MQNRSSFLGERLPQTGPPKPGIRALRWGVGRGDKWREKAKQAQGLQDPSLQLPRAAPRGPAEPLAPSLQAVPIQQHLRAGCRGRAGPGDPGLAPSRSWGPRPPSHLAGTRFASCSSIGLLSGHSTFHTSPTSPPISSEKQRGLFFLLRNLCWEEVSKDHIWIWHTWI
ncbi:hypothetical protein VULLAG_LOCUS2858 [Vulpes lagopus]